MESVDYLQPAPEDVVVGPMRIFCKKNPDLNMAVCGNRVLLVKPNPEDETQHWFQYYNVGKLTDGTGRRAFVLVNTKTGLAMVDTYNEFFLSNTNNELKLLPYSGNDEPVITRMLWSQGHQLEGGFTEIRTFKDSYMALTALGGSAVEDGTVVRIFHSEPEHAESVWKVEPIPSHQQ
nr:unnamed protein product [Digitaria exilis]